MKSKTIFIIVILVSFVTSGSFAQSNSYATLKDKFNDRPDVHSFSVSGWMSRLILKMAGEYEFCDAIENIQHIRFITIPAQEFAKQHVSVNGFKKLLRNDSFEELAVIRDQGDDVTIFSREGRDNKNYYFILIEDDHEVIGMEIKGHIDPQLILKNKEVTYSY